MAITTAPEVLRGSDLSADLLPMDVAGRIGRLRDRFAAADIDALVVTNLTNIRYLTGFTGSAATVIVTPSDAVLVTDGRYATQAPQQLAAAGVAAEVQIHNDKQLEAVHAALATNHRVGLEAEAVTWAAQRRFVEALAGRELVATAGVVETLRLTKDLGELDRMLRAAATADAALAQVWGLLVDAAHGSGITEVEFGFALDTAIRELGASGNSFESIVAAGPNGAMPHARPSERPIARGDLLVLDFGAKFDGYCSDMTRTVGIGSEGDLSDDQVGMWNAVIDSQAAGVAAVASGIAAKDVDAVCRDSLSAAGLVEYFTHSTGHGVGLDIHEAPRVSKPSDATLAPGFVVTVEPGVYRAPLGGVRIEDTVVVTEDGCWPLTTSPKTLFVA